MPFGMSVSWAAILPVMRLKGRAAKHVQRLDIPTARKAEQRAPSATQAAIAPFHRTMKMMLGMPLCYC